MRFRILSLMASILMTGSVGYACVCVGEGSPRVRLDQAKIVFSGTVIELNDKAVKLDVEKAYKGNVGKEFILTRSGQETSCNIFFSKGDKYLVYADEYNLNDKVVFRTHVCAGTDTYANAKDDIEYLETPAQFPELGKLEPPNLGKLEPPTYKKARPKNQPKIKKR